MANTTVHETVTDQDVMANTTGATHTYNVTLLEKLNNDQMLLYSPILTICVLIMIIGIIGNIFVLYIYKYKFRRSSARNYIICLAMMDMSVCIVGIPYHVIDLTHIYTYTYVNACRILSFLIGALTTGSIFVLLVVAIDRYLKVCRPLKKQVIDFGDKKACAIAIGVAFVISIPNAILYGESSTDTGIAGVVGTCCFIDDYYEDSPFPIAFQGFNMLVCITSIAFLIGIYSFIVRTIYVSSRAGEVVSSESTSLKLCTCRSSSSSPEPSDSWEEEDDKGVELLPIEPGSSATREPLFTPDTGNADITPHEDKSNTGKKGCGQVTSSATNGKSKAVDFEDEPNSETGDVNKSLIDSKSNSSKAISSKPQSKESGKAKEKLRSVPSGALVRHHGGGASKKNDKTTRKITLMMLTITIVFVLSYVPFIVVSFMDGVDDTYWNNMSPAELLINDLLLRIYLVNNMANAIIYSFWDKRFRNEVILLLRRLFCCSVQAQTQRTTTHTLSTTIQ